MWSSALKEHRLHKVTRPVNQSVSQPSNHPINQTVSQAAVWPVWCFKYLWKFISQSISQTVSQSLAWLPFHWITHFFSHLAVQSLNVPYTKAISQVVNLLIIQWTKESNKPTVIQSLNPLWAPDFLYASRPTSSTIFPPRWQASANFKQ